MVHASAFPAYRNSIFANGKVVFVSQLDSAFFIQVNKRSDMRTPAVFIIGHCVMAGRSLSESEATSIYRS